MSVSAPSPSAYRQVMHLLSEPTLLVDFETALILDANEAAQRLFGLPLEELRTRCGRDLHPGHASHLVDQLSAQVVEMGEASALGVPLQTTRGPCWADVRLRRYEADGRSLLLCSLRDVTPRVQRERELATTVTMLQTIQDRLAASEARYRSIVGAAADAILVSDFDSALFVEVNQAACDLFGYSPIQFRRLTGRLLHPPDVGKEVDGIAAQLTEAGFAEHPGLEMCRADRTRFFGSLRIRLFEIHGMRLYVTLVRDVSEQVARERELARSNHTLRETQAQLVHASKMAALGALGAGIAHEMNQPLTVIRGFVRRMIRTPESQLADCMRELDIILTETERMSSVVDNVRRFGRQSDVRFQMIAPERPLNDALELVYAQLDEQQIALHTERDPDLPRISADAARIEQVLLNLLVNARDSLVEARPRFPRVDAAVRRIGDTVVYSVTDNGPGVPASIRSRLFDPFFTTKDPGVGMGLGLSIAYSIVIDHGGTIEYDAAAGGGARFEVRLPVPPAPAGEEDA